MPRHAVYADDAATLDAAADVSMLMLLRYYDTITPFFCCAMLTLRAAATWLCCRHIDSLPLRVAIDCRADAAMLLFEMILLFARSAPPLFYCLRLLLPAPPRAYAACRYVMLRAFDTRCQRRYADTRCQKPIEVTDYASYAPARDDIEEARYGVRRAFCASALRGVDER